MTAYRYIETVQTHGIGCCSLLLLVMMTLMVMMMVVYHLYDFPANHDESPHTPHTFASRRAVLSI